MKRVLFTFVFASLLLSFGLASAMTVQPYIAPGSLWDDGGVYKIKLGTNFKVEIQMDNPDGFGRATISMPLTFYGSAGITGWTLVPAGGEIVPSIQLVNGFQYNPYPNPWFGILDSLFFFSYDGNVADTVNFTASGIGGMPNGAPLLSRILFNFNIAQAGTFCVDSCSVPNVDPAGKFDWLWESPMPSFGGPYCWEVKLQPDQNAVFTNCPTTEITGQWNAAFSYDLNADDPDIEGPDDLPFTFVKVSGPGDINAETGMWTWQPGCGDVGSHEVVAGVYDTKHQGPDEDALCTFSVSILNAAPVIAGDCGDLITIGTNSTKTAQFTATDANGPSDTKTWTATPVPTPAGVYGIDNNGLLSFTPTDADALIDFVFTVRVTDCNGDFDECDVTFHVISEYPFGIVIEKDHGLTGKGVLQGHHGFIDVTKTTGSEEMHGFDFLIGYDASALAFTGAIKGVLFDIPGNYEWEYFTYRYNWNGNCGNGCPTGLLRVVGMAESNNGVHNPVSVMVPDGTVLFQLDFLVTNDRTFECMYVPVYFYWMDCGDNTIAFRYRSDPTGLDIKTAVSDKVYWYNGFDPLFPYYEITDREYGFPTYYGVQDFCLVNELFPNKIPTPFINFFDGGFDIICAGDIDARGDVNLNGISNEIADAVVFTNYFIYGLGAFVINVEGQIAATEINGDGYTLTVADLVYLIRVIVGDALPLPKVAPNMTANVIANGTTVNVNAEVGAAYFLISGNAGVSLADGAAGMEIKSNFDGINTKVLVFSFVKGHSASGAILNTTGNVLDVQLADYNGNAYKTVIVPAEFGLKNYPNPFNPVTTLALSLPQASDWTISIFNVVGQKVADFSGHSDAGVVTVDWNASNEASGIYFYKAEAGNRTLTEKMVLLK